MAQIRDVAEHCAEVSYFISELWQEGIVSINPETSSFEGGFQSVCEWLDLAKSLVSVSTNSTFFDASNNWFMSAPAMEYADRRDRFLNDATLRISRFMFLWCSLECLLKTLWSDLPDVPRRVSRRPGLVGKGIYYITINSSNSLISQFQDSFDPKFEYFSKKFMCSDMKKSKVEDLFVIDEFKSILSVALNVIVRVRNSLAHGTHFIPEDEEYGLSKNEEYFRFLDMSSSNLLLSTQIMLSIYLNRKGNCQSFYDYKSNGEANILEILSNLQYDGL